MAIISGDIQFGVLYTVSAANVIYNSITVIPGDTFIGVTGVNTFTGLGVVSEVLELKGQAIEFVQNAEDTTFPNVITTIAGMAIEFVLNDSEKVVNETTKILGMSIELIDYPFYSFEITETSL